MPDGTLKRAKNGQIREKFVKNSPKGKMEILKPEGDENGHFFEIWPHVARSGNSAKHQRLQ